MQQLNLPLVPTLPDYYDMLEAHDWTYAFSDDQRAYRAGRKAAEELVKIANQSPEHEQLHKAYSVYIWEVGALKPPRPEDK